MGLVYIDSSRTLRRQTADGRAESIASGVTEAKVSPNGLRIAFVPGRSNRTEIWGYDVGLRASYQLATDTAPVSNVTWAPAGNRIAYLRADTEVTASLRIRNLTGAAATTTVAAGALGTPAWFPDSTHVVFAAALAGNGLHKAYVINVVAPPANINPAAGLPGDATTDVYSPVPSPDGHQIAFLSQEQVWLMNADGTRPTALTSYDAGSFPYSCRALAWTRT
jgi:Tol biopolymer transport system component